MPKARIEFNNFPGVIFFLQTNTKAQHLKSSMRPSMSSPDSILTHPDRTSIPVPPVTGSLMTVRAESKCPKTKKYKNISDGMSRENDKKIYYAAGHLLSVSSHYDDCNSFGNITERL